jgi:hypothetical protein
MRAFVLVKKLRRIGKSTKRSDTLWNNENECIALLQSNKEEITALANSGVIEVVTGPSFEVKERRLS